MNEPTREAFTSAQPFPHVVVDGFWDDEELRAAEDSLRPTGRGVPWVGGDNEAQRGKYSISDPAKMPPAAARVARALNSLSTIKLLERITGLAKVAPDPGYWGGGVHQTWSPGRLAMHVDFNRHPRYGWRRALNLLLYVNRDWRTEYGGELELWDREMRRPVKVVEPVFNRAVIFLLGQTSWHGHPNAWRRPDQGRLSFAAYYYVPAKSGDPEFLDVQWHELPGGGYERAS